MHTRRSERGKDGDKERIAAVLTEKARPWEPRCLRGSRTDREGPFGGEQTEQETSEGAARTGEGGEGLALRRQPRGRGS